MVREIVGSHRLLACSPRHVTEHRPLGLCAQRSCTPLPCEPKRTECPLGARATGLRSMLLVEKFSKTNSFRPRLLPASCRQLQASSLRSPNSRSADEGAHCFGELFERHRIRCGRVA